MPSVSPFESYYRSIDAPAIPYGQRGAVVAQCEPIELEYAAIRKSAALMDGTHRGLVRLTGPDRLDFLHRLVTNDCRSMKPGQVRRALILSARGRIVADLLIVHAQNHTLIDTDVHQAPTVARELQDLLFGENVHIEDLSEQFARASLYGPGAGEVLNWWRDQASPEAADFRYDDIGEPGLHIWAPPQALGRFADRADLLREVFDLRFIGWMGWNIARIEQGHAMFNIDFGPDNLPHEAGPNLIREAVSFTKGCYRGQEIVARMQSRGHPARRLVGFRVQGPELPVSGVNVLDGPAPDSQVIGAVTSSTVSPMLGSTPIGLAMVKWGHHEPGSTLYMPAEGRNVRTIVHETPFYRKEQP